MQTGRGVPPVFQPARVGSTDAGLCEALLALFLSRLSDRASIVQPAWSIGPAPPGHWQPPAAVQCQKGWLPNMRIRQVIPVALTLGVLVMVSLAPSSRPSASPSTALSLTPSSTGHLPISFEANQGQADSSVRFLAHGPGYSLFLTPTEALLALSASGQATLSSRDPASPAAVDAPSLASASPPMLVG